MGGCAYIFLDESGNFDFGPRGTRHLVLTSVSMRRPFPASIRLDDYRHSCIEAGADIEYFHCHADRWNVREAVFKAIAAHLDAIRIHSLVVEKARVASALQEPGRLYQWMLGYLVRRALHEETVACADEVVVMTDTIPVNKKRKAVEKSIQFAVARRQLPKPKYRILHHRSCSHYGLQIADYCCWAIFRKWEKGDGSWRARIEPALRGEFFNSMAKD